MTNETPLTTVLTELRSLADSGRLPTRAQAKAVRLADRLSSPVRLALLGRPGTGKTTLANVLCGTPALPADLALPTCDVRHGETTALHVTLRDGSRRQVDPPEFDAALALSPLLVELQLPAPGLASIAVLDIDTDGSAQELTAAARWAARRAEMAIWVSRGFDDTEQAIWRDMPEKLRHHAFLVLNGIDTHAGEEARRVIASHRDIARGEFLGVFPLSAQSVAEALADGPTRGAGCGALLDAIGKRVDMGRQADIDTALLFLKRHGGLRAHPRPHVPLVRSSAPPVRQPATVPLVEADVPAAAIPNECDPLDLSMGRLGAMGESIASPPDEEGMPVEALETLRRAAREALEDLSQSDDGSSDVVLSRLMAASEQLAEIVPQTSGAAEAVMQAANFLVLLQMEGRQEAGADAAAALLQVRRELELELAR